MTKLHSKTLRLVRYVIFFIIISESNAFSDKWVIPKSTERNVYSMGKLKCTLEKVVEKTEPGNYPKCIFFCIDEKKEKFRKKDYCGKVYISPDNKFALGLSNSGLSRFAYWIVDKNGHTIAENYHFQTKHCTNSVTIYKEWYDDKNPDVKFVVKDHKLIDVKVRGCNGDQISLQKIKPFT